MDKRYQVFISSTFRDLVVERQAVLKAILEIDHMPAGMELFPASDDSAWRLIQDVILSSDYYVVIVGGRYGSTDEAGVGYTEREYDFALQQKIPVVPLLHANPDNLPRERTETDEEAWKRLQAFRARIEKRHTCVYWNGTDDLKAKVIVGLTSTIKRFPRIGWVRSDRIPTDATVSEILTLRTKLSQLESELQEVALSPPKGTEDLLQGDDAYNVKVAFKAREEREGYPSYKDTPYTVEIEPSWDDVFGAVAPKLIDEESDGDVRAAFRRFFEKYTRELVESDRG